MKQWKQAVALLLSLCVCTACSAPLTDRTVTEKSEQQETAKTEATESVSVPAPVEEEETAVSYPQIEAVDFSDMTLASAEGQGIQLFYPAEQFTWEEKSNPLTLFLNETIDSSEGAANITVLPAAALDAKINQEFLDQVLLAQQENQAATALTIQTAELRELNGELVIYMESTTEITDEVLDLLIEQGQLTEEAITEAGGRDVYKAIPATKSVSIYSVVDGYLTMYTGSYYDDAHKETLIDSITVLITNTQITE